MSSGVDGGAVIAAAVAAVGSFGTVVYDRWRRRADTRADINSPVAERVQLAAEWKAFRAVQEGRIHELEEEVKRLRGVIAAQDTEIAGLRQDNVRLRGEVAQLRHEVED